MVIMIIDPDTKQLTHTKAYLEKNNVTTVAFRDPMEAVQYGYNHAVDAVYTEVVMPHITGRDVVNLLRKRNSDIRAYFLSDTDRYLEAGKACQIAGYYIKPLREDLQNANLLTSPAVTGTK